jgi:hypothetical protein
VNEVALGIKVRTFYLYPGFEINFLEPVIVGSLSRLDPEPILGYGGYSGWKVEYFLIEIVLTGVPINLNYSSGSGIDSDLDVLQARGFLFFLVFGRVGVDFQELVFPLDSGIGKICDFQAGRGCGLIGFGYARGTFLPTWDEEKNDGDQK